MGAGQYGQLAKEIAICTHKYNDIAFLDDKFEDAVGPFIDWRKFNDDFFVAIGDSALRSEWIQRLIVAGKRIATLVHPQSYISSSARVGKGSIVEPFVAINTGASIGTSVFLCAGSVINHNAIVGSYCQIDAGAIVASRSIVPEKTKVYSGTVWQEN